MVLIQNFEQNIQLAQQRLDRIYQWHIDSLKPPQDLLAETLSELSTALEELHVVAEELQHQNDELLATRQELEQERQRYQELFEFAPDGYLVTDTEGVIRQANHAIETMLGVRCDFLVGKPLIVFISENEHSIFRTQLNKLIPEKNWSNWEINLKPRQGQPFPVELSIARQKDNQGNVVGLLWSIRNLSERVLAEQKIRDQAALLDVATDGICLCDLNQQISFWNQGAEAIYGWKAEEMSGKNYHELMAPEATSQLAEAAKTITLKSKWQGELETITQSGQKIIVDSHWTLVRDREGKPRAILIVDTDITEKKKLEAQFYRAQRLESLGTLASGIAHDFNNLLTPILGISQILPLHLPNLDESSQELLEIVQGNAQRGANLIKQMLSFTRGIEPEPEVLTVSCLFDEIYQIAKATFPKSIDICFNMPKDLWQVRGDSTLLHQVLMNLCVNARDAMPDGGALTLSASNRFLDKTSARVNLNAQGGNYVLLTISDTGSGIDASNLERIFDPFFTTKQLGKGTGLGLSTTLNIIQKHSGSIEVSSQVGQGTQFQVFLPAVESAQVIPSEEGESPRGQGELILVVDDEALICQTIETVLTTYNYKVLTAKDGVEAIKLYNQHQEEIALVLMDMMMPTMDGSMAIRALQQINPQVKIIATSGLSLDKSITTVPNVKAFLPKPYTPEALLKTLNEILTPNS